MAAIGSVANAGAIEPGDLCSGDPCTITVGVELDEPQVVLDFGSRAVVLRAPLDAGDNDLTIRAGRFTIASSGQLQGTAIITIDTDGDVEIGGTQTRGAIRMVDDDGGDFRIVTRAGSVRGTGKIVLNSNSTEGDGGGLTISADGDVFLTGSIEAVGSIEGSGGDVDVAASGNVSLTGSIELNGGGFDGGSLDIEAGGSLFLGPLIADGSGDLGNGGDVDLEAGGGITLLGSVQSRGSRMSASECGDGGNLSAQAGGTLTISRTVDVGAREGDCWGGDIDLAAASIDVRAELDLRGRGGSGNGGELSLSADSDFVCNQSVQFGGYRGGAVRIEAGGDLDLATGCTLDGSGSSAAVGLVSEAQLVLNGTIRVGSDAPRLNRAAAAVDVTGCTMHVGSTATITSLGEGAENTFTVGGELVVAGTVRAQQRNSLVVPPQSAPVVSGSVVPLPTLVFDPNVVPCGIFPSGTATPTATPSSTSTPIPNETATSTPPPSSTVAPTTAPTATLPPDQPTATPTSEPTSPPSPTSTEASPTESPTPTSTQVDERSCFGDCDGDGAVAVSELVRLTNLALGREATCDFVRAGERVGIPFLVRAVRASLDGCGD